MNKYKIVLLNDRFKEMVKFYPQLVQLLYLKQNDSYSTKQVELLFLPFSNEKEKLLSQITQREDYQYFHGIHRLYNSITQEVITMKMNEYDIEVEESGENEVVFQMMKSFSKNFSKITL